MDEKRIADSCAMMIGQGNRCTASNEFENILHEVGYEAYHSLSRLRGFASHIANACPGCSLLEEHGSVEELVQYLCGQLSIEYQPPVPE